MMGFALGLAGVSLLLLNTVVQPEQSDPEPSASAAAHGQCSQVHTVEFPKWPKWVRHKVTPRERIDDIAARYGVSSWQVRNWNGFDSELERVKTGTRIKVKARRIPPPRVRMSYTVAEGDTWWRVAVRHGVSSSDLRAYNWPYRGKMSPGTELKVWVDPIVFDWIATRIPVLPAEGSTQLRLGAVGVGTPDHGTLLNGVSIPKSDHYRIRFPNSAYGTTHAVQQVVTSFAAFRKNSGFTGEISVGSMSTPKGGLLGHHRSHQTGRDLDVRLPRKAGVPRYVSLAKARRVDWLATWELVKAFAHSDVVVIFLDYKRQKYLYRAAKADGASEQELSTLLQYPRGGYARRGLVRHFDGHDKHMHVRFGCGPCEPACLSMPTRKNKTAAKPPKVAGDSST